MPDMGIFVGKAQSGHLKPKPCNGAVAFSPKPIPYAATF